MIFFCLFFFAKCCGVETLVWKYPTHQCPFARNADASHNSSHSKSNIQYVCLRFLLIDCMFKVRTVFLFNATFVHVTPIRSLPCYAQKWARPVQEKEWPSKYDKWMYKQNRTNSLLEDLIIAGFVISCRFFLHYDLDPSWANFSANKHCANRCYSAFFDLCTLWQMHVVKGHDGSFVVCFLNWLSGPNHLKYG